MGGYHIDAICEHLQACAEGEINKLLINIAPRHGKSTLVSVLYPCWLWTHTPTERMLFASYSLELARRDSTRNRRVIETEWFKERWPHVILTDDVNTKTTFENTMTGVRQTTSVGGPTTGLGGTHLVLDDPHNMLQAESAQVRATTIQWIRESWSTRANPGRQVQICIMQRLHAADASAYYLEEGGWDHLCLPTEYEGNKNRTSIGWEDPRQVEGEVLWKERFGTEKGLKELAALKKSLGSVGVAGQLQQRPVPRGGATFQRAWQRFWYDETLGRPDPVQYQDEKGEWHDSQQMALPAVDESSIVNSWDLAFKGGEKNDFVVGQTWARGNKDNRANHFLLAQERGNWDFVQTLEAMWRLYERCENRFGVGPSVTLVEEKANGAGAIASLKAEMPALVAVNPEGGKESRASGVAPLFEAGNVWLPHPEQFPWVDEYLKELTLFPRGVNDDQVDATTQALIRMRSRIVEDIDMGPSVVAHSVTSRWRV